MKAIRLTETLSVSPQLEHQDFAALAEAGVCLVINNRPDGEAPNQLPAAEAARLAASAGIGYRHIPVAFPAVTRADIDAFCAALRAADGAVHAHCRSGTRSANLWLLGELLEGRMTREDAAAFAAARGIAVRDALAWLDRYEAEAAGE